MGEWKERTEAGGMAAEPVTFLNQTLRLGPETWGLEKVLC